MNRAEAVNAVYRLILEGNTRHEILDSIEEWRQTKKLRTRPRVIWSDAAKRFEEIALDNPKQRLGFVIAATLDLYRQCVGIADYAGALRALQILAKVEGVLGTPMEDRPDAPVDGKAPEGAAAAGGDEDLAATWSLIQGTGTDAGA